MSIFNQVTDTVGAVRVFREAQAPDKYVTICDNFAKSFNILQLQLLPPDSRKMWDGRANVSKIALSVSDQHIICLKGKYMLAPSPLVDAEKALCSPCSYRKVLPQKKAPPI